ncbi:hypothetical protein LguiA_026406 [Lonicera macranthoides]
MMHRGRLGTWSSALRVIGIKSRRFRMKKKLVVLNACMRSVGASQQVPTRSRNYRKISREIADNAHRYCSLKTFEDCASNENVSVIEDDDVPISPWTFLIPDQDGDPMTVNIPSDVNMNNMQIPEHVKFLAYEGNQNRNRGEEDGLVTSEVVPGAGGQPNLHLRPPES